MGNNFTARRNAIAVSAIVVCLSVCLSVTSRCSTETAKRRVTQITPLDSAWTLVFLCRKFQQNSNGVTPNGGAERRWGKSKLILPWMMARSRNDRGLRFVFSVKPRLHNTTGCQTGCTTGLTTGCIV